MDNYYFNSFDIETGDLKGSVLDIDSIQVL